MYQAPTNTKVELKIKSQLPLPKKGKFGWPYTLHLHPAQELFSLLVRPLIPLEA
jgi:hypothetical protein